MPTRLIIPSHLPRARDSEDYNQGLQSQDWDVSDSNEIEFPGPGTRAPPVSPTHGGAEELLPSGQVADPIIPKRSSSIASYWSLFSSYVRRVISAACPLSCRPGGGIELTRASAGGRPAHVCVVEVAMDVDVILTVRSWWPNDLSIEEVREHGLNQAHASARQWWRENNREFAGQGLNLQDTSYFRVPADSDVVKRDLLPLVVYFNEGGESDESDDVWSTPSSRAPDSECAICLDSGSDCHLRACHHGFHHECLTKWFCKSRKLCCPLCRSSLDSLIPENVRSKVADTVEEEVIEPEVITLRVEEGVIDSADSADLSPVNGFL
ncbi:hypothetical protein Pmar_PMAR027932 [Perkinsus marinus ATCC 50983]|uniref:RING-type domain-containing protein n=1 Tax=Perkinsus marinus (strain ATCC 50983 / TXsc) TaxID=423536 RepID=C5LDG0_PERM5|nr:hypothetical protein Pmar_PMAR027932 [Perkinsus marinus ATCC 50983]EER05292.1 hypothetical protein Pmar_PMAR027932 [Perkinsus marinus ATCC 50983]|eukprot:XP_002773476.1 hypothetical protein Pmar_PMAR027932 [Perkinsus marinus ATCC 50983]